MWALHKRKKNETWHAQSFEMFLNIIIFFSKTDEIIKTNLNH